MNNWKRNTIVSATCIALIIAAIVGNALLRKDTIELPKVTVEEHEVPQRRDPYNQDLLLPEEVDALTDLESLMEKYYIVDGRTMMTPELFDVKEFLANDLKIKKDPDKPQILIFHTHSYEMYADSADESEGVIGVGRRIAEILEREYGLNVLHDTQSFEPEDDEETSGGAYERMEPKIREILRKNPSIRVMIDLHRDGVPDNIRLVTEINGKPTAKIMFYNGISKLYENGVLEDIEGLENKNVKTNLAFSFNMELTANKLYPGISRGIYVNAYRYSTHMKPRSLLLELGAQTNTKEEAYNAAEPVARILAEVLLGE